MTAYYNEIDPYAAEWLRNLIAGGLIAPGYVDERSIEDVRPYDLKEFTQCHFFAGVGVWSYALRQAGWPDDRPVWTGSCPCQPFSAAGKGAGFTDERHLWPAWFHLITQCEPGRVFGEQVASKDGLGWLDLVQTDLEGAGYASGAIDLCSAGVGAPHIRQRLYFVAERLGHPEYERLEGWRRDTTESTGARDRLRTEAGPIAEAGASGGLADSESLRGGTGLRDPEPAGLGRDKPRDGGAVSRLADPEHDGRKERHTDDQGGGERGETERVGEQPGRDGGSSSPGQPGPTNGLWRDADWLSCRDGKWRPVEPGTFPLANGAPSRVGRLRAYGNAINAKAAETFIRSYLEVRP